MNSRNLVIIGSVVMFHLAALWALHTGLLKRMAEVVVPVMMISQSEPPPPPMVKPVEPPPPVTKTPPPVTQTPPPQQPVMTPPPSPPPVAPAAAAPEPAPVLAAPATPTAPATVVNTPAPAPAPAPAPPSAAAPAKVELPNSKADYLHNPPPDYPRMSVRLGEQGQVMVKVLIGADGVPQKAEVQTSSGFERLDKAALEAAMRWRYVPGKRGGVAEAMWYQVPITFNLKKE
jgi:protein TonB